MADEHKYKIGQGLYFLRKPDVESSKSVPKFLYGTVTRITHDYCYRDVYVIESGQNTYDRLEEDCYPSLASIGTGVEKILQDMSEELKEEIAQDEKILRDSRRELRALQNRLHAWQELVRAAEAAQ